MVTYADSCIFVHCGNDVNPGFHDYEAEGTALNIHEIAGSAPSTFTDHPMPEAHSTPGLS
eukprot:1484151-Pyramimonas_sp.AAC.1